MMLTPDDFAAFFKEVHDFNPFPWQKCLLRQIAENGEWPPILDLPTGSGKTAAIDIAVFHLAMEAGSASGRRAPVRIALVVDRRLVVDDAFGRAKKLSKALEDPPGPATAEVAKALKSLLANGPPLIARRLRGGIPREDDWARTPSQPTVLCSTVDQIGSRLLFRGYGVSNSMRPVHAGLLGSDCLILLDEAHLAEPFRQTLNWVQMYQGERWREVDMESPWGMALLTATPGDLPDDAFSLNEEDRAHPILKKRLEASKPAYLRPLPKIGKKTESPDASKDEVDKNSSHQTDIERRAQTILEEVQAALEHFEKPENGVMHPAIGVVVNRVARARRIFELAQKRLGKEAVRCSLMIGPTRSVDRDQLVGALEAIRTGQKRALEKPYILIATQTIEAGVDIDLDALITEAAPVDSLRQRFGRLNRDGRDIKPYAAILAAAGDLSARMDDPVYGKAIRPAWDCLKAASHKVKKSDLVDFGISAFSVELKEEALTQKADAPVLLPAHLDLLSQTAPVPAADPEVALYLHGPKRQADSITVVWRADIDPEQDENIDIRHLLTLVPPRSREAIELPLWVIRRWLQDEHETTADIADMASSEPAGEARSGGNRVFRWRGDDDQSRWIRPNDIRPGDMIVVPASFGGVDEFGWNPRYEEPARDVAQMAAAPYAGRRFAVRVAPGLMEDSVSNEALAEALAGVATQRWRDVRKAILDLPLPDEVRLALGRLDNARNANRISAYLDLYGIDEDGRPRGVVFVAPSGLKDCKDETDFTSATEDDIAGSMPGYRLTLQQHSEDVEAKAECFAKKSGLSEARVKDLKLAGYLHDAGKRDPRFQAWLHYGDPLGPDPEDTDSILAKSDRPLPRRARAQSDLPVKWRHEALSVRLACEHKRLKDAHDPELVLWLVGTHHGYGRPFFPHADPDDRKSRKLPSVMDLPTELPAGAGPQSLAFDYEGLDWAAFYERLKARYGVWELARMEAILRLADHRASEGRSKENAE